MKMSDVFELPMQVRLDESEGGFEMFSQDKDDHDFSTLYSLWSDLPDAQAAAHAINCHDELVGALKALFNDYKELADSGDAGNWTLEDQPVGIRAISALEGAK